MSLCLLHIYDVTNTGNESTNTAIARFNAIGRSEHPEYAFHTVPAWYRLIFSALSRAIQKCEESREDW